MGFGDSFKRIKNKLTRAQSGVADAESKGDEAQAEETKEAELETGEHKEVNKFIGGFRRETRLVQQIAQTHASKYSLAKVLSSRSASTRNLNIASKKLMSVLKQTGINIQSNLNKAQWAAGGVSVLPAAKKDIELLVNLKGKLIQNLSNETAITVKKLQAEAAEVSPIIKKNQEIRAILDQFRKVLGMQNSELARIKTLTVRRIQTKQRELEKELESRNEEVKVIQNELERRANM